MHLIVRADGSAAIGMGHVMRCLALAEAWIDRGGRATFIGRFGAAGASRLQSAGARVVNVPASHPDPADLAAITDAVRADQAGRPWVVIDGYHFDSTYQQNVRAVGARVVTVDDTGANQHVAADILVNQNVNAERLPYAAGPGAEVLAGAAYVMLRREFRQRARSPRTFPSAARNVLVTMGGGDPDNVTGMVLDAINGASLPGAAVKVVIGMANPHRDSLQAIARAARNVEPVIDPADMASLMEWADLAVTAAGSTSYETAFVGVPSIMIITAANQVGVAAGMHEHGAAELAGRAHEVSSDRLAAAIARLSADRQRRVNMSRAGRELVDGHGADRIVDRMLVHALADAGLTLRPAAAADAHAIWTLANDRAVRQNAFSTEAIPLEAHLRWFDRKLRSGDSRLWVLTLPDGTLAGIVRYDRTSSNRADIDIAVSADARSGGLGTALLVATWQRACGELRVCAARGVVMSDNHGSRRAFQRAGFTQAGPEAIQDGRRYVVFERHVPVPAATGEPV
ncbi:MAG TPA: UDP-2,4-diacetamido-2,4,6-trideoxy-beta-L-altropyranose hydrolase [Vicinamibacterales bacterium]|nr:UDP-2,4-diacetamido-2,4,6-trideoxy-beta-L-altropyranose hydrolase [Vicinamibacterales bacterium]